MLLGLIILCAVRRSSTAPVVPAVITNDGYPSYGLSGRSSPDSGSEVNYRTEQDIIWSCLATIFACTWVAIHPNIPGPWDSQWAKDKRRIVTLIYAIVAPEFIALWALRQWLAARRIAKEFNGLVQKDEARTPVNATGFKKCWMAMKKAGRTYFRGPIRNEPSTWTVTHGFFVQMGGFVGYEGDIPKRVLMFEELKEMIKDDKLKISDYTEGEIKDKSKGDALTKLLVVLQTSWFICQCLARWTSYLPVTELEVVALAFAALNAVTYGLWWKKPQDICVGVRVQLRDKPCLKGADVGRETNMELGGSGEKKESWFRYQLRTVTSGSWKGNEGLLVWHWEDGWLVGAPLALLGAPLRPLRKMAGETESKHQRLRVPIYFADSRGQKRDLLPLSSICVLFGAIHLIPWWSPFPSAIESLIWRLSAALVTAGPVVMLLAILAFNTFDIRHNYEEDMQSGILDLIIVAVSFFGAVLYIFARLALLTLACTTLRSLPPDAFKEVTWTSFLPHV